MANVPVEHVLIFAAALFALAFVGAGSRWMQPDGQILFLFLLAAAATEVSIGLALLLLFQHRRRSLNIDDASELRG
jgi:NADH-quinone oxidoreductase subunit K